MDNIENIVPKPLIKLLVAQILRQQGFVTSPDCDFSSNTSNPRFFEAYLLVLTLLDDINSFYLDGYGTGLADLLDDTDG